MKFLVADGSVTSRRIIVSSLQRLGYTEIEETGDGREALRLLGPSIRCVITDWEIPYANGMDLVRVLRMRPDGEKTPVLMITTRNERRDILAAKQAGVNDYILRPFSMEVLREKLKLVLQATA